MTDQNWTYSGTLEQKPSNRELANGKLAREAAAEGIVLLKNEGILPFHINTNIALLGCGAEKTIKGGIGSGDVNNRENVSLYQGIKDAGAVITSEDWLMDYENRYQSARLKWKDKVLEDAKRTDNPFDAYAANPFRLPEGPLVSAKDMEGAAAAVYVVSRISGEGRDRRKVKGDYYLSDREYEDISFLNERNIPTVLIINAGGPVELIDILENTSNIKAILNISQLGQEGGHAVADVLFGRHMPGGRLTDTWAKRYADYPSAENFGYLNGNLEWDDYKEGIYVGYRYFDSFGVKPLYPFGYGLTYTNFAIKFEGLKTTGTGLEVEVSVANIGEHYPGREVVQVYISLPQNGKAKEYRRLAGFAKTGIIEPTREQKLVIPIPQKQLAAFSEDQHAWIVEQGNYGVWTGRNIAELDLCAMLIVSADAIIEENKAVCKKTAEFKDLGASEYAEDKEKEMCAFVAKHGIPVVCFQPYKEEKRVVEINPAGSSAAIELADVQELIPIFYGKISTGAAHLGAAGIRVPGSAGETTGALEDKYEKRSLIMADGPAGLRLRQRYDVNPGKNEIYGVSVLGALENGYLEDEVHHEDADTYYQYCTAFPVGTALAQTWDTQLMEKIGTAVAVEMEEFHIDLWLAPGMNIHRNPLCGRNFEYYSEDPLISGKMAAAVTKGVQSNSKCGVTIKHFACNNQEDNRMGVDARVSERALREIYFRGFEIAIKESAPIALMTSYNRINGVHAANNKDICTTVAREEWGFDGIIMSDWDTTAVEDGSISWKCIEAGNDIIMPGNSNDDANLRAAYENGKLTEKTIREVTGRIIGVIDRLDCK